MPPSEHIYSVGEITGEIRESLEERYTGVWIEGEISNHRQPGSGHHYFTLKDARAQLSCVLFKGAAARNPIAPQSGIQVQIYGDISVYEARGQYQLIARIIQPKGHGDLQAKFEALKKKLDDEGLFDSEKKKPIPTFARTIGVVTSPTGAALQDILNVLRRRAPWVRVIIQPVRVQGDGSGDEIAAGIREFSESPDLPEIDLLLVTRGGGSIEDLWAFNEETVARAIASCPIPVMTGVGHEIDFTIADFVADRREPTPSAAAENAVPDGASLERHLAMLTSGVDTAVKNRLAEMERLATSLWRELQAREPGRMIQNAMQSVDFLKEKLETTVQSQIESKQSRLELVSRVFQTFQPERTVESGKSDLADVFEKLQTATDRRLISVKEELHQLHHLMESLSPVSVFKRGFSMTLDSSGKPITDPAKAKSGEKIVTHLAKGKLASTVD